MTSEIIVIAMETCLRHTVPLSLAEADTKRGRALPAGSLREVLLTGGHASSDDDARRKNTNYRRKSG